jgi:hypothetical protein
MEPYQLWPVGVRQIGETIMTDKKPDAESDAARNGADADKNREELVKRAEKGIEDAKGKKPKDQI